MALAPEQKLTYPLAGPDGPAAFNGGVQGFEAQSFRGLGVFNSTPVSHCQEHSHTLHITQPFHRPALFNGWDTQISHGAAPCSHSQYEVSDGARRYDFQNAMMTSFNTHNNVHHTTL